MNFTLALTPIGLILILMVGLRWSAAKAGAAGYLAALGVAVTFFGAGRDLLGYAHVKALLLAIDVLLVIWAAFLHYRVADEAGAIRTIGEALPHLTTDMGMQALIIGWVFASFLQGVGGFGVPVAVIAPLLVSLGFKPLAAVVIPSIGHGWAVTFGSLGSSFQALQASTGLTAAQLAPASGIFLGLSGLLVGWMVAHAAAGWSAVRRLTLQVLILGVVMGAAQYLVAVAGLWNLAAFAGGLAGLVVGFPLARGIQGVPQDNGVLDIRALLVALTGYALLVLVILGVQLIPAVKDFLSQVVIQLDFPEVKTSLGFTTPAGAGRRIVLFGHTGTVLVYASGLAYLVYRRAGLYATGSVKRILNGTLRRVLASSVSIISMVTMAVIMEHAGMTDTLARGLASGMGSLFPFMAPWIGALGAFMTGSNTNSNVVFGALQLHTAEFLGYSAAIILAGQTAGAALASLMAPTKVVVGASTAGMAGREGEVMRKLSLYTGLLVLLISLLTIGGVWLER
ncbi:MAG TPA: L-lactate permease [Anaerolineales bacterium]|nr:L-lactate permease [Anaerolineales bacterium]